MSPAHRVSAQPTTTSPLFPGTRLNNWAIGVVPHGARSLTIGLVTLSFLGLVGLVYLTGGTHTSYPNLLLFPGLFCAAVFGARGGFICGLAGGVMLGPIMPLHVSQDVAQPTLHWIIRLITFVLVATVTGRLFDQLRAQARQLASLVYLHPVTGLPNRAALTADLKAMAKRAGAHNEADPVSLISIQLIDYQDIVSVIGTTAEEQLQVQIATRIKRATAESDGTVYQISGDMYSAILPHADTTRALQIAQSVIDSLQHRVDLGTTPTFVSASAGVASIPHERQEPERLLTRSWLAVQHAISSGRLVAPFDRDFVRSSRRRLAVLGELEKAIAQDALTLCYQPKISLQTGELVGLEVLVRWNHPAHGAIPPSYFVPAAEQTSLIHPFTRWIVHTAVTERNRWFAAHSQAPICLNISARNFGDAGFVPMLLAQQQLVKPGNLEVELTETALMIDPERVIADLKELANAGIPVSVDDFGTGYSSLAQLRDLPVTALKIDKMFITDMRRIPADLQIVKASISMAKNLGLSTVAEGVEDKETLLTLRELQCDAAQGFFIAAPMPGEEVVPWIESQRVGKVLGRDDANEH